MTETFLDKYYARANKIQDDRKSLEAHRALRLEYEALAQRIDLLAELVEEYLTTPVNPPAPSFVGEDSSDWSLGQVTKVDEMQPVK